MRPSATDVCGAPRWNLLRALASESDVVLRALVLGLVASKRDIELAPEELFAAELADTAAEPAESAVIASNVFR